MIRSLLVLLFVAGCDGGVAPDAPVVVDATELSDEGAGSVDTAPGSGGGVPLNPCRAALCNDLLERRLRAVDPAR
jgi:hypothetical protein